jgi:hypothetical protein
MEQKQQFNMKYIITCSYGERDLQKNVNLLIQKGYVPLGGVSASLTPTGDYFWAQALTKEQDGS